MSGILLYPLATLLYAALAFYYWRTQWVVPAPAGAPVAVSPAPHYFTVLPLALHAITLLDSSFAADGLHLGFGVAVSAILWLTVLIYWLGNFVYRLDGLQALERLEQERPAVVLSDIEMPRMDGFDLLRNIRADARWQDLPVIMITSRIAAKHREHAAELGASHYLGKPYREDELLSLVRRYAAADFLTTE